MNIYHSNIYFLKIWSIATDRQQCGPEGRKRSFGRTEVTLVPLHSGDQFFCHFFWGSLSKYADIILLTGPNHFNFPTNHPLFVLELWPFTYGLGRPCVPRTFTLRPSQWTTKPLRRTSIGSAGANAGTSRRRSPRVTGGLGLSMKRCYTKKRLVMACRELELKERRYIFCLKQLDYIEWIWHGR